MKTHETKTQFSQCLLLVWPKQGIPGESWRPEHSENVEVFKILRFQTRVIGCQNRVKIEEEKIIGKRRCKKRHSHNFEFLGLKRIARPRHMLFWGMSVLWKTLILAFLCVRTGKNSSGRRLDNIEDWDWRLPHVPIFLKHRWKNSDTFKIVGPSPLWCWMIQDRVRQNGCF